MSYVNHFLSLPADLYAELRDISYQRGMSVSDFMLESLMKNADAHLQTLRNTEVLPASISRYTIGGRSRGTRTDQDVLH